MLTSAWSLISRWTAAKSSPRAASATAATFGAACSAAAAAKAIVSARRNDEVHTDLSVCAVCMRAPPEYVAPKISNAGDGCKGGACRLFERLLVDVIHHNHRDRSLLFH